MRLHGSTDSETDGSENRGQGGAVHEDLLSESGLEYPVYSRIRIVEIPKERCEASVGADAEASTLQWRFTLCARRDNFGRRDVGSYHGLALFSLRWRRGRLFSTHLALPTGLLTVRDVSAFFVLIGFKLKYVAHCELNRPDAARASTGPPVRSSTSEATIA